MSDISLLSIVFPPRVLTEGRDVPIKSLDPDSQGLQFTWDVINGGPISPASDPTLGLFTEQAFGVPTLTDIGSATHYMAVPNLTAM